MTRTEAEELQAFVELAGPRAVRSGDDAAPFMVDWRDRHHGTALGVVMPTTTEETSRIVAHCRDRGIAIYPQGGNTGLCAGSVPPKEKRRCIVLSAQRMNKIHEIDADGDVAVVGSGVTLTALHDAAAGAGRLFPLRLGSEGSAQIGGLISTNAGGTGAVRYGVMRDLVLGLEAVMPDGSVLNRLGGLRKDNRGYDWKHLLIGGEGSLGFITAAALKLFPAVRDEAHAACIVSGPAAAVALFRRLRERFDTAIHAFELVSGGELSLALRYVDGLRPPFSPMPQWVVMIELGSSDPDGRLSERLAAFLERVLTDGMIEDAVIPSNMQQVNDLWAMRHSLSEANKKAGHGIVFDVAVRVSRAPDFIEQATRLVERHAPLAEPVYVCHLGDGNVHLIAMIPKDRVPEQDVLDGIVAELQDAVHSLAESMGGSFSAEHGIGRKLAPEMARRMPAAEMNVLRRIKQAIDPQNLFAPGVLLEQDPAENGQT